MIRSTFIVVVAGVLSATAPCNAADSASDSNALQLTLPRQCDLVVGVPYSIYFDNVVLTKTPEAYRFEVKCEIGQMEARRWTATPTAEDVGVHKLTITVSHADGKPLARASTRLQVTADDAGAGDEISLLIVGDSLTNATQYPNEIARLLGDPETASKNPKWRMVGTHRPKGAADGVAHEGYGGWTWQRFVSQYDPNSKGTRRSVSPFVYADEAGKPQLNVERYFKEEANGHPPDYIVFMLGINDCFGAAPDDPDPRIDIMFEPMERLLSAFRRAAPDAEFGICLTTPPNARDAAFEANYKGRYPRWGWKKIQHRLVQRQMERFETPKNDKANKANKVFPIATHLNLDPIDGYPENNGVHPNAVGYKQVGASIYSWLKGRLAARPKP